MEEKQKFIIAFDISDIKGSLLPLSIHNAFELKMSQGAPVSKEDIAVIKVKIERFLEQLTTSEEVGHLFSQIQDKGKSEQNNNTFDKYPKHGFEYRCFIHRF